MKKAINLERTDGRRIQMDAEDIQFVEENGEGKTNIMVRHFGQITVRHPLDEVLAWIDGVWGRTALYSLDEARAINEEAAEADEGELTFEAEPLHTDRSRKSVLGMMRTVKQIDGEENGEPQ
jgi:hypothetical protein